MEMVDRRIGVFMQDLPRFRWFERKVDIGHGAVKVERVLQQARAPVGGGPVEWFDVPTVIEGETE